MGSISNPGDRISELPDALISHILSFLHTKEAVRTSILSTKWKQQWTHVPKLKFVPRDYPIGINRVLLFRGSSNIQTFNLALTDSLAQRQKLDYALIECWIDTAIWRNVVEVVLCVHCQDQNMELPRSVFTCKTLKVLKLDSYFVLNPPTTGYFPSLKVLDIMVCHFDTSVLERIFSNCPVLEELAVMFSFVDGGGDISISAPELKKLKICCLNWLDENEEKYSFHINAPKLENFGLGMHHYQHLSAFLFHFNVDPQFKANIRLNTGEKQYDSKIAILDAISSVKHLSLSSSFCFEVSVS